MTSFATPSISDLKVTPIAPWGMAIDYTVSGAKTADANLPFSVTATGNGKTYGAMNLAGDTRWVNGAHRVYWNLAKDGVTATVVNGVVGVRLSACYCVIDLSAGADAASYPVDYLIAEPSGGFNTMEYKTTKLVLKRVDAGSFIMGEDQGDESHRVTLTKPLYMGLYEVTQRQWKLVTGASPYLYSQFGEGDASPVRRVSYDDIRGSLGGARWPSSNAVDSSSFLGKLRARTGLDFDLPTEAQWEYTCRAGTTTTYSFGNMAGSSDMWYFANNSGDPHEVGTKPPNPWGFYDMHGNVREWCLDWYGKLQYGTDPKGSSTGSYRMLRGGYWENTNDKCTSSYRCYSSPAGEGYDCGDGLRLVWTLPD